MIYSHLLVLKLSKPYMSRMPMWYFELESCPIETLIFWTNLHITKEQVIVIDVFLYSFLDK